MALIAGCQAGANGLDGSGRAAEAADPGHPVGPRPAAAAAHRPAGGGPSSLAQSSAGALPESGRWSNQWTALPGWSIDCVSGFILHAAHRDRKRWTALQEPRRRKTALTVTTTWLRSLSSRGGWCCSGSFGALRGTVGNKNLNVHRRLLPTVDWRRRCSRGCARRSSWWLHRIDSSGTIAL